MKTNLTATATLAAMLATCVVARDTAPATKPVSAPDKQKVSYAFGMNLGYQRQQSQTKLDMDAFIRGLRDALQDKPMEIKESEMTALLNEARVKGPEKQVEPDKQKISYSLGVRTGTQLKRSGMDVDPDAITQGLRDVLDGKPTKVERSEVQGLFAQAKTYGLQEQSKKNKEAAAEFLAKNAKEAGVQTLPDGLQYRVIEEGTRTRATTNDMIYIKMRGTFVDGKQFIKHNHYLIRCGGGMQGWRDALTRMTIGSKWQIFVPSELAFGEQGEPAWGVGPDATLIFDLELLSIAPPDAEFGRGRLGHAFEDSDVPDAQDGSGK